MSGAWDSKDQGGTDDRDDHVEETVTVLRHIWWASGSSGEELERRFGSGGGKVCKNMARIGFGGLGGGGAASGDTGDTGDTNTPVDDDVRAAWRARLAREGKLRPDAVSLGEALRRDAAR